MLNKLKTSQKLRESSKILSKQYIPYPRCTLFCCDQDNSQQIKLQNYSYFSPPSNKISIKKLIKERSMININNNNKNDNSFSKQSKYTIKSNVTSININQNKNKFQPLHQKSVVQYKKNTLPQWPIQKIHFNYGNKLQNETIGLTNQHNIHTLPFNRNYNRPIQKQQHTPTFKNNNDKKVKQNIEKQIQNDDISIEDEINKILNINQQIPQEGSKFVQCGQAFQIQQLKLMPLKNKNQMAHFSFGQNQKTLYMQKYMKNKEQNYSKQIQFAQGTFNKQIRLNFTRKQRNLIKSQQQPSQQSLVIESYQSALKAKSNTNNKQN